MDRRAIAVLALLGATAAAAQTPPAEPSGQITVDGRPQRPRFGRLFVSPMGEPFRGGEAPEKDWFAGVDANHDGQLTRTEFMADAMRFFATLDLNHDRTIGPTEIDNYEQIVLPEIGAGGDGPGEGPPREGGRPPGGGGRHGGGMGRGGGGMGGGRGEGGGMGGGGPPDGGMSGGPPAGGGAKAGYQYRASGAGRFGYIATPEPVTAADTDLNRSVTDKEFVDAAGRRFALLDTNGDGVITPKELPKLAAPHFRRRGGQDGPPPPPPEA
ncbi:EF-hand domain-containing protein [Sphingomonas sp. BIUV-7]|uniref:EF-hand domain-containing protein n=1 Tax=Sphingomonas natans TaxID=3063330 RepID=A0ABT8Y4D2_9SPHN|nr:EF-hand domain-containing protein [Sphingomonas sp. BIUV-7]MDO6413176.1 EF-hand domain-containing protein [Sphingomonas sp. BIUV-7]